jgi:hypothetical protein
METSTQVDLQGMRAVPASEAVARHIDWLKSRFGGIRVVVC